MGPPCCRYPDKWPPRSTVRWFILTYTFTRDDGGLLGRPGQQEVSVRFIDVINLDECQLVGVVEYSYWGNIR